MKGRAIVSGATGLVGRALVAALAERADISEVLALTRREIPDLPAKARAELVDYEVLAAGRAGLPASDAFFCALGTTIKAAGSRETMHRIDHDYAVAAARAALASGASHAGLVSSVGASARGGTWYLRLKAEVESSFAGLGFERAAIVRPSILLGERPDARPAERLGQGAARLINPLLAGSLRKYRGVSAKDVASVLISAVLDGDPAPARFIEAPGVPIVQW